MSVEPKAMKPHVTVIGGGLAGMVAALRLAERGCDVDLYEADGRLGGKAGAIKNGEQYDEHGYHIFPMWYQNIWKLVDELGIRENFADVEDFVQIEIDQFPKYRTLTNLGSVQHAFKNLRSGVLSRTEMALFFYSTLDLMSQPWNYRAFLDQTSVNGFIRGRFYRTERVALQYQDLLLKGISVPSYDVSAMTVRNVLKFWLSDPLPMHRILRGDLQQLWIEPIQKRLEVLGVKIHLRHKLTRLEFASNHIASKHVSRISLQVPDAAEPYGVDVDRLVVAIPHHALERVLDDEAFRMSPALFNIRYLQSAAMASLNIYCKRQIPDIPREHVNLLGSQYGLSFIDVGQWWSNLAGRTVFNLIASDYKTLEQVSPQVAMDAMIDDLIAFIPTLQREDIERVELQPHLLEPLFMNQVGAWRYRPNARTEIDNLYLAGDYCRTHIDLVSMEGAVSSGLSAAEEVRKDLGIQEPVENKVPREYPRWLMRVLTILGTPVALVLKAIAWATAGDEALLEALKARRLRKQDTVVEKSL